MITNMSDIETAHDGVALDVTLCQRARLARDPRFDGEFFIAVKTTGIYCRPVCPARPPAEKNVLYFRHAVQAATAGYRPCLRCRPESAPGSPAWHGSQTTVHRALSLIEQGALNDGKLTALALRLGVGERYLRKLFQRELGVSPHSVAHNKRLLLARKLLVESTLPLTDVAHAAGFNSVRRFNSAMQEQFRQTPGDLRKSSSAVSNTPLIRLELHYRPPYDWEGICAFLRRHCVEGVESLEGDVYQRKLLINGAPATVYVSPVHSRNALELRVRCEDNRQLMPIMANVRRMFDLDANPPAIADNLGSIAALKPLLQAGTGLRSPGYWSLYEAAIRAIIGQQVSTAAARGICARLARACSADPEHLVFPSAADISQLDDTHFPMPTRRRETLRTLCRHLQDTEESLSLELLASLKGVGPWTVAMTSMRGAGDTDVFPDKDLGLEKAWQTLAPGTLSLTEAAANWRPWRSYAANLLWRSLPP
tara:strand:+ start:17010 stop:18449 length:1440 start_codon:yes stop_codon:yes gene_type:complete